MLHRSQNVKITRMPEMAEQLKGFFETKKTVAMAFLFGSAAAGRLMPESDVDVAVWFEREYTLEDADKIQGEIESLVHRNVDLIVLNSARSTVSWAALRGKPLLIRDYRLYLRKLLDFSREAEDFREFIFDLWRLRRRLRGAFT